MLTATRVVPLRDPKLYACHRCGVINQIRKGRDHAGYCRDCKPYSHEYERNANV